MLPCLNNGTCIPDLTNNATFSCNCTEFATGDRCETGLSTKSCALTNITFIATFATMDALNCTSISPTFIGNNTIAPLSCFGLIAHNLTHSAHLSVCAAKRTHPLQMSRIAWLTTKEHFTLVEMSSSQLLKASQMAMIGMYANRTTMPDASGIGTNNVYDQAQTEHQYRWVETFDTAGSFAITHSSVLTTGYTSAASKPVTYVIGVTGALGAKNCGGIRNATKDNVFDIKYVYLCRTREKSF
jgi:hypothetical protein